MRHEFSEKFIKAMGTGSFSHEEKVFIRTKFGACETIENIQAASEDISRALFTLNSSLAGMEAYIDPNDRKDLYEALETFRDYRPKIELLLGLINKIVREVKV